LREERGSFVEAAKSSGTWPKIAEKREKKKKG